MNAIIIILILGLTIALLGSWIINLNRDIKNLRSTNDNLMSDLRSAQWRLSQTVDALSKCREVNNGKKS